MGIEGINGSNSTPIQRLMSAPKTDKTSSALPIGQTNSVKNDGFYPGLELRGAPEYTGIESTLEFLEYLVRNDM